MRYVALLRGINVSGANMIKMEALRKTFEYCGFTNVVSYINSGNLAFDSPKKAEAKLVASIEEAIRRDFGLSISVMVREQKSIADVVASNPFDGKFAEHKQMNVLFLRESVPAEKQEEILSLQTDKEFLAVLGREIYMLLLCGFPESLLGRGLIERRLKIPITVRNWRTVEQLAKM
jgi:uncharacterized protein (DUF1697 family)